MEAVILIGIQASGKSTFFKRRFFDTHVRISLDLLRTRRRMRSLMEACFDTQQRFVLDNTNVLVDERRMYIDAARRARFRVVGYFFEPDPERALMWNRGRSGRASIPDIGLLGTLKRLERPTLEEGFDELYRVHVDETGAFVTEPVASPIDRPSQP